MFAKISILLARDTRMGKNFHENINIIISSRFSYCKQVVKICKGTLSRDFRLLVFSSIKPTRPLISRLNPFCLCHLIRRDIRFEIRHFVAQGACVPVVWGYLSLLYFCWIFPLKEEKGLVKSVWDFSRVNVNDIIDKAEIPKKNVFGGWYPYEIFLLGFSGVNGTAEIRILLIFSTNTKPYLKLL
jgi:hypothetical protein